MHVCGIITCDKLPSLTRLPVTQRPVQVVRKIKFDFGFLDAAPNEAGPSTSSPTVTDEQIFLAPDNVSPLFTNASEVMRDEHKGKETVGFWGCVRCAT